MACPSVQLVLNVAKGNLSLLEDGSFTYDYTGGNAPDTDSFTYTLTDSYGTSNISTVSITISLASPSNLLLGGNAVDSVKIGTTTVTKIYLGTTQVY